MPWRLPFLFTHPPLYPASTALTHPFDRSYLFFMNGLWVWVPLILAYDSAVRLSQAVDKAKASRDDAVPSGEAAYSFIFATLVVYIVLVPICLISGKEKV